MQNDLFAKLFIVALYVIAKDRKWFKCLLIRDWLNKLWLIRTVNYYVDTIKEILISFKLFCKMKMVNVCEEKDSHAHRNMRTYFFLYAFNIPGSIHKKHRMSLEWQVRWQRNRREGETFYCDIHRYLLIFEPCELLQIHIYIHIHTLHILKPFIWHLRTSQSGPWWHLKP